MGHLILTRAPLSCTTARLNKRYVTKINWLWGPWRKPYRIRHGVITWTSDLEVPNFRHLYVNLFASFEVFWQILVNNEVKRKVQYSNFRKGSLQPTCQGAEQSCSSRHSWAWNSARTQGKVHDKDCDHSRVTCSEDYFEKCSKLLYGTPSVKCSLILMSGFPPKDINLSGFHRDLIQSWFLYRRQRSLITCSNSILFC